MQYLLVEVNIFLKTLKTKIVNEILIFIKKRKKKAGKVIETNF